MSDLVVALGHPDRGDDAVAHHVVARLSDDPPSECVLTGVPTSLELLDLWNGHDLVVVVDAVVGEPHLGNLGTGSDRVTVLEPTTTALGRRRAVGGSHDVGLQQTIDLARVLGRLPQRLVVVGVRGDDFRVGAPLSPEVAAAVPAAVNAVRYVLASGT
jgi:hydrogenase maturation protease